MYSISEQYADPNAYFMTKRPGFILARRYGFAGMRELVADIPANAHVIDVGAGRSNFASSIAKKRPDVTCVQFDLRYPVEPETHPFLPNLEAIGGNILDVQSSAIAGRQFQRVYSYWLLGHLMKK